MQPSAPVGIEFAQFIRGDGGIQSIRGLSVTALEFETVAAGTDERMAVEPARRIGGEVRGSGEGAAPEAAVGKFGLDVRLPVGREPAFGGHLAVELCWGHCGKDRRIETLKGCAQCVFLLAFQYEIAREAGFAPARTQQAFFQRDAAAGMQGIGGELRARGIQSCCDPLLPRVTADEGLTVHAQGLQPAVQPHCFDSPEPQVRGARAGIRLPVAAAVDPATAAQCD